MHKEQLVKAFQLMKQGEKGQASMIVKGVLREEPKNLNAWWLMSHLLEDEDKIVKALERVLTIDPNHTAARSRLAQLRPEYSNLVSDETKSAKQAQKDSAKADDDYWAKLNEAPQQKQSKSGGFAMPNFLGSRLGVRILIGIIVTPFLIAYTLWFNAESDRKLPDINGNTPEDAVEMYFYADAIQDVDMMYQITCPALHGRVDSMVAEYDDYYPADEVDFSETTFYLRHHDIYHDRAYVTMSGVTTYSGAGFSVDYDWTESAESEGYDFYGEFAHKVDGVWVVCTEYEVPKVDHDSSE